MVHLTQQKKSLRFENEDDYGYEIFSIVHTRAPASFWRENVIAVVILQGV